VLEHLSSPELVGGENSFLGSEKVMVDAASADAEFLQLAALYRGRPEN
jgi:hypothetical protein